MPVTDTGTVKAEATIQRADLLRDAPMKGNVTWERVQLGNLTRLIYGEDRGWRGALEASAQFNGTPGALHFTTAVKLRDFRRFDISSGDAANPQRHLSRRVERQRKPAPEHASAACPWKADCFRCRVRCGDFVIPVTISQFRPKTLAPMPC